jgi:hypothetical protein
VTENLRESIRNLRHFARAMERLQNSGQLYAGQQALAGQVVELSFRAAKATEQLLCEIIAKGTFDDRTA